MSDTTQDAGRPARSGPYGLYLTVIEALAGGSLAVILAIMVWQVAARYLFNSSLIWAEELCRYLLIWQTFLLLGLAYQRGAFVMLDILPYMLSARSRVILKVITALPVLIFLAVIVVEGWDYASRFSRQTIPAVDFIWTSLFGHNADMPVKWVYLSVPVGSALLFLHVLADAWLSILDFRKGAAHDLRHPEDGEGL